MWQPLLPGTLVSSLLLYYDHFCHLQQYCLPTSWESYSEFHWICLGNLLENDYQHENQIPTQHLLWIFRPKVRCSSSYIYSLKILSPSTGTWTSISSMIAQISARRACVYLPVWDQVHCTVNF